MASRNIFCALFLLLFFCVLIPTHCARAPSSNEQLSKRHTTPKYDSEISLYKNIFKAGDPLLLEVKWWAESNGEKRAPSDLYRSKSPIHYSGGIGRVVVEKFVIPLSKDLMNNSTRIFIAAMLCKHSATTVKSGCSAEKHRLGEAIRQSDHLKNVRPSSLRYLLRESAAEVMLRTPPLWQWRPKVKLQVVLDEDTYEELPELYRSIDSHYLPPTLLNNLEVTEFEEIREDATELSIEFSMLFMGKLEYHWLARIMQAFALYEKFGLRGQQLEDIKQTLLGNSWQVLYLTSLVAVFHLIFDFLAFKNDISFWRKRTSMRGVSVHSLLISFVCQVVVWLYLYDQETSKLVLVPAALGIFIDLWKISKAVTVRVRFRHGFALEMQEQASYVASHTKDFDRQATRLVLLLLAPTVASYSIYSLIFNKHKGWYSWALESITTVVYAGGFLLMLPQVFVNYKLRSVAAMPWRAFVYRALNTFIDDLFAFVIKMPTMHRLSCFRDDVVFVIYIIQRWKYPIDYTRQTDTGKDSDAAEESTSKVASKIGSSKKNK